MVHKPHRRRNYLINKRLQLKYALYIFITLVCITGASILCLTFGIWNLTLQDFSGFSLKNRLMMASRMQDYTTARAYTVTPAPPLRLSDYNDVDLLSIREKEIIRDMLTRNSKELAGKAMLLFIFFAIGTVFLTHKIAGPLFRIKTVLHAVREGDVSLRVHLRRGNQAKDMVPVINSMLGSLDYSLSKMKSCARAMQTTCQQERDIPHTIVAQLDALTSELNRYTTSDVYTNA